MQKSSHSILGRFFFKLRIRRLNSDIKCFKAAVTLGKSGRKEYIEPLIERLKELYDWRLYKEIIEALEELGANQAQILRSHLNASSSSNSNIRAVCASNIGKFKDDIAVRRLEEMVFDEDTHVTIAASLALAKIGIKKPEILEQLFSSLVQEKPHISKEHICALKELGAEKDKMIRIYIIALNQYFDQYFSNPSYFYLSDIIHELKELGVDILKVCLEPLSVKRNDWNNFTLTIVEEFKKAGIRKKQILEFCLEALSKSPYVRDLPLRWGSGFSEELSNIIEDLRKLGASNDRMLSIFLNALSNSRYYEVKRWSAEILGLLDDKRAIQSLVESLEWAEKRADPELYKFVIVALEGLEVTEVIKEQRELEKRIREMINEKLKPEYIPEYVTLKHVLKAINLYKQDGDFDARCDYWSIDGYWDTGNYIEPESGYHVVISKIKKP